LCEAFAVGRFREGDELSLHTPPQQDLRRCPPDAFGELLHGAVPEVSSGSERAVRLDRHAPFACGVKQAFAIFE
jgi:hypothetical protein